MRTLQRLFVLILIVVLPISCSKINAKVETDKSSYIPKTSKKLVVGYAQVGAESEWRLANTRSIKEAAEKENIELLFTDSLQKQENQIKAIKSFIAQKVDYIAFSPIVDSGWNEVLKEAKQANIPVIIVDRKAKVDESLFKTFIGSDFYEEGKKAAVEMAKLLNEKGNIYEIQGTIGSDPAIKRKQGFEDELLKNYPEMKIVKSESGDFFKEKGNEVMKSFLKADAQNIDGVYSHNDEMALGAITEIEAYGFKPGYDIKIVSVDAVSQEILKTIELGKINVSVQCNPYLGPLLFETIKNIEDGKDVDKYIYSEEGIVTQENVQEHLIKIQK